LCGWFIVTWERLWLSLWVLFYLRVYPQYLPDTAEQRVKLAAICHDKGDAKMVIKLINGLHRAHPDYQGLKSAFTMMTEALESLPNMHNQAKACRTFIKNL
jgi:hypothetical protein